MVRKTVRGERTEPKSCFGVWDRSVQFTSYGVCCSLNRLSGIEFTSGAFVACGTI